MREKLLLAMLLPRSGQEIDKTFGHLSSVDQIGQNTLACASVQECPLSADA